VRGAAGKLSANGWPRRMAKLGRPAFGDTAAIFALAGRRPTPATWQNCRWIKKGAPR